jgi:hypothetical protein
MSNQADLDALVAERDSLRDEGIKINRMLVGARNVIEEREAEIARLRKALAYHQCEGPELPCPVCAALGEDA